MKTALPQVLAAMFAVPIVAASQTIPAERRFVSAWGGSGYPGTPPCPSRIVSVRDFGAAGTGATNDFGAFAAAIAALRGAPGVVFVPAGTYLLSNSAPLRLPSGVILRGERSTNTTLRFHTTGHALSAAGAPVGPFQPVLSAATARSTVMAVSNASAFADGDDAEIEATADPAWGASSWGTNAIGQMVRIAAATNGFLTLAHPLRLDFPAARRPRIRRVAPVTGVGIENLKVERLLAGTPTSRNNQFTIHFRYAARCWVRGVEGAWAFGAHVGCEYSSQIGITGCYFHDAHEYDGGGSGYGVRFEFRTGECRVENCVFRRLRHSMLVQIGANGNVFGYNDSTEGIRTEFPHDYASDITVHGNYPFANLWEGNACQLIGLDDSHGANGPWNTFFRNRAQSHGLHLTDPLCRDATIVGNELRSGRYALVAGGALRLNDNPHFAWANRTDADPVQPAGATNLAEVSLYLGAAPATAASPERSSWWTLSEPLPTIGPPRASGSVALPTPASARRAAGGPMTVGPPSLAQAPTDLTIAAGQTAAFGCIAYGTPAASYAWFRDGAALPGATNASLARRAASPRDEGRYAVRVWDAFGSVLTEPAVLRVLPAGPRP